MSEFMSIDVPASNIAGAMDNEGEFAAAIFNLFSYEIGIDQGGLLGERWAREFVEALDAQGIAALRALAALLPAEG